MIFWKFSLPFHPKFFFRFIAEFQILSCIFLSYLCRVKFSRSFSGICVFGNSILYSVLKKTNSKFFSSFGCSGTASPQKILIHSSISSSDLRLQSINFFDRFCLLPFIIKDKDGRADVPISENSVFSNEIPNNSLTISRQFSTVNSGEKGMTNISVVRLFFITKRKFAS